MKSGVVFAAALARLVAAQSFDFAAILDAPSPSLTGPELTAVKETVAPVNTAAVAASISAEVSPASASITGAAASAASTQEPAASDVEKRGFFDIFGYGGKTTKTTMKTSVKTSAKTWATTNTGKTSVATTTTASTEKQSSSSTTSSTSACPTTPEDGTYCGFINPEDPCAVQPDGYGTKVEPDTVEAFKDYPQFHKEAQNAATPSGYVNTFKDLNGSTSANSYIAFVTLESYDTAACAKECDSVELCTAFNIYVERDPSLNPTSNNPDPAFYCPNPTSITNYKCSLWGSSIDETSATNEGGYRDQFQVVIVGSNGYDKTNNTTPAPQPGWEAPQKCNGGGMSHGGNYHVGSDFFPGPFNPGLCKLYAEAQTAKNRNAAKQVGKHAYSPCNMFNAYMVHMNGKAQGTYCSLFNTPLSHEWASFGGAWSGKNWFGVDSSWTYALSHQDSGSW